jgi:hypothetical protein
MAKAAGNRYSLCLKVTAPIFDSTWEKRQPFQALPFFQKNYGQYLPAKTIDFLPINCRKPIGREVSRRATRRNYRMDDRVIKGDKTKAEQMEWTSLPL